MLSFPKLLRLKGLKVLDKRGRFRVIWLPFFKTVHRNEAASEGVRQRCAVPVVERLSPVFLRPHHGGGAGGDTAVHTMTTTTTTTTKATTTKATGADIAAQVAKEVETLKAAFASLETALQGIGPIGLDSLAAEMGKTVNEKGRPEFNTWVRFTLAVCAQKPSFTRQQSLFGIARGAARDKLVSEIGELKGKEAVNKFAKTTTKASQDGTTCKLVLARPAAWDIAFE